jgi:thiosulfate/3-mercaptopyruvate sulfurtransferase
MLPALLEPEILHALAPDQRAQVLVVDLSHPDRFLHQHVPGAVYVHPNETQAKPPFPGLIPDDAALTQIMQRIGLTPERHVVVYDDEGGGWAGRFIWLLEEIGHNRWSYLNGGIHAWLGKSFDVARGHSHVDATTVQVSATHHHTIDCEQLRNALEAGPVQILDARSPAEYRGERQTAARSGHIPGAVNYEWTRVMDPARQLRLRALDQIEQELSGLGLHKDRPLITHCQSHHRSGLTWLVAKLLGYQDVKAYAGSWSEWGNRSDTPIEH